MLTATIEETIVSDFPELPEQPTEQDVLDFFFHQTKDAVVDYLPGSHARSEVRRAIEVLINNRKEAEFALAAMSAGDCPNCRESGPCGCGGDPALAKPDTGDGDELPTDAMVNAAEDVDYASMPWHGPDEMREGVYEMVRAALAARQPVAHQCIPEGWTLVDGSIPSRLTALRRNLAETLDFAKQAEESDATRNIAIDLKTLDEIITDLLPTHTQPVAAKDGDA